MPNYSCALISEVGMRANSELRPFLPALSVLKHRIAGVEVERQSLAFAFQEEVHTEEEMLLTLLSQAVFAFDTINERGVIWDIKKESFSEFKARSNQVTFLFIGYNSNKLKEISNWIIELCDWEATFFNSNIKH